jgi:hypothetical protein
MVRSKAVRTLIVAYTAKALGVQNVISPTVHNWIAFDVVTPLKMRVKRALGINTPTRVTW